MGTPSRTVATSTCRCRAVSAVRIPSRTASSSAALSASSSGPGPAWARLSQCSGSSVISRSRQARRRTFTAASSSANLYAHVRKLLSPRKSSSRRRTESAASSAASWASSSSSTAESWGMESRRRKTSNRAARRSSPCSCATASSREAPSARRSRCHSSTPGAAASALTSGLVSEAGNVLPSYRRGCALRGGKGGSPPPHPAFLLGDPACRVRRPPHGDAAVPDVDVRVMALALRELREPVDELDRGGKRRQLELPHDRVVLLCPAVHEGTIPICGTCKRRSRVPECGGVRDPSARAPGGRARRGDREAAAALFRRYWRDAWRAAFAITGRRSLADDVAADGFERAFGALGRFDDRRPFGPWLHRIVANRAIDLVRAERRISADELPELVDLSPAYDAG